MSAPDDLVLRFDRFPTVHKAQRDAAGRLWQIVRIEAPFCWAAPHGSDASLVRYRIEAPRRGGRYRVPLATADQRRLYDKMRKCGVDRAAALAAVLSA
jgi:hypothetical protein